MVEVHRGRFLKERWVGSISLVKGRWVSVEGVLPSALFSVPSSPTLAPLLPIPERSPPIINRKPFPTE